MQKGKSFEEIELEDLLGKFEIVNADFPSILANPPSLEELRQMFSSEEEIAQSKQRKEFDQYEEMDIFTFGEAFGEALGEGDSSSEEQPLVEKEKTSSQSSPISPISQELRQRRKGKEKQESSVNEDQKNLNEELLQACKNDKNIKAVLLVRKGANPNALCQSGESAISYAKTTGNNKLVAELQKEESKKINSDSAPPEVLKDIPDIVPLSENRKEKEPTQEIRRRKGPDEGKIITVNQSLPVFQPKQTSLPKYAAYGGLIGAGLGAGGILIAIGIGCAIAGSLVFPPLGLALVVIGACATLGLATGTTYSKKDAIANKIATVFHKNTADNKTFTMDPDTHPKNA